MAIKRKLVSSRADVRKIQSNEDGNQAVVAGEEVNKANALILGPSFLLLASTNQEEITARRSYTLRNPLEKTNTKVKRDCPNGSEGFMMNAAKSGRSGRGGNS